MATYLRYNAPGKHAILNPRTMTYETPDPTRQYAPDDDIVLAAPWAFSSEDEIAAAQAEADARTSVPVPTAPENKPTRGRKA